MAKKIVTRSALTQRINRKLAYKGEGLRKTRGDRWRGELGDYYTVNEENVVTAKHVDPIELGRELGALREFETCESING